MKTKTKVKTPELNKMSKVQEKSKVIGEFLDWLHSTKRVQFAEYHKHGVKCEGWDKQKRAVVPAYEWRCDEEHRHSAFGMYGCERRRISGCDLPEGELTPCVGMGIEALLAQYFKINTKKAEEERRALLASLQSG
jgi:hypothetical protein